MSETLLDQTHSLFVEKLSQNEKEIAELKTENEMLRGIIALIPGNVFWKNNEAKFLGCNHNVAKIFGFNSPNEIVGKTNADLFDADLAALTDKVDKEVSQLGEEKYLEEKGLNINFEPAIYLTKKLPLFDSIGNIIGILGVSFDITERKKMEEDLKIAKEKAEASNNAKSQFLAVVNHELRTPLASIIGLLNFLKRGGLSPQEEKKIIDSINDCTKHLLNIVNDVLDFSRLETGQYNLRITPINLKTLLQEIYNMLLPLSENKGIKLEIHLHETKTPHFLTDARILRQILINLVTNAIKFTDQGSVIICTKHIAKTNTHIQLEISVVDTGIGIDESKLAIIFEPFQQLEDAYTRQSSRSGAGLGLSIVKKLAALINSKVSVVSEPGKGSTFSFVTEFEITQDSHEKNHPAKTPKNTPQTIYPHVLTYRPYILLIEDDPIVQYIHKKMLSDLGCEVDAVASGSDALKKLEKHDMVFVDISLPDTSGFDVIKTIRQREEVKTIPVVALTVYNGKEEKEACLKAGADAFKTKPISLATLKKVLLKHLPQR